MRIFCLVAIAIILIASTAYAVPVVVAAVGAAVSTGIGVAVGAIATTAITASFALNFFGSLALSALSGMLSSKPKASSIAQSGSDRTEVVRSSTESRKIIYGKVMVSGPLIFAGSSDETAQATSDEYLNTAASVTIGNPVTIITGTETIRYVRRDGAQIYFIRVVSAPAKGQYSISGGVLTFNAAEYGVRVFISYQYTSRPATGKNAFMHLVIALADHEVEEIGDVYLDDRLANTLSGGNSSTFGNMLVVSRYLGNAGQQADPDLMAAFPSQWTANHRGDGVAYLYVRLRFDQTVYPNGLPNIKAVVKGKKLYDPRSGLTAYSNNWALCVRDYVASTRYGISASNSEIDDAYFIAAANTSDENVTLADGTTQKRYTCDGVIDTKDKPIEIMKRLLTAGAGSIVYTMGKYRLFAGAYSSPVATLNESDLRDTLNVMASTPRKDLYNGVRGTYVDPDKYWQPGDFPPVTNPTYAAEDGESILNDIELPYTTNSIRAQRLAKIHLEKSRQAISVSFPAKMTAFKIAIWDRVYLNIALLGWVNKVFLVTGWKFADGGVDLTLQEESSACYDWAAGVATTTDPAPDTNFPDPFNVSLPGKPSITETLYTTSSSAGVKTRVSVSWASAGDALVAKYEVVYRVAGSTVWLPAGETTGTNLEINDIAPNIYDFGVRSVGFLGGYSTYAQTTQPIYAATATPSDITNFSIIPSANNIALASWNQSLDMDVQIAGYVRIRYTPLLTGQNWNNAIDIGEALPGIATSTHLPLLAGTYMAKFIGSSGKASNGTAMVVTNVTRLQEFTPVATLTEAPAFSGTRSNLAFTSEVDGLALSGTALIDDMLTPIDTWDKIDSLGGIATSGTYTSNFLDLGAVYPCSVVSTLQAEAYNTNDTIDSRTTLIDSWANFDGDLIDDARVEIFIRTTNDEPAGSPTWSAWQRFMVGDYTCRAVQFQLRYFSADPTHNIGVTTFSVTIHAPARTESQTVTSLAAPTTVNFLYPFKFIPEIGITAKNMVSGDYYTITGESETGFVITFFNAAAAAVSRTFMADAKGIGRQVV